MNGDGKVKLKAIEESGKRVCFAEYDLEGTFDDKILISGKGTLTSYFGVKYEG